MNDLNDENEAKNLINKILFLPDLKKEILTVLTDAVIEANNNEIDQWAVTVTKDNRIRLMVGHYVTVVIYEDGIWVALDKDSFYEHKNSRPADFEIFLKYWEPDQLDKKGDYPSYKNADMDSFSINGYFSIKNRSSEAISILRQLLFAFIKKAINEGQPISSRTQDSNSTGVLKYLRSELDIEIPDPGYY